MASDSQTAQASAALTLPQLVSSPLTKVAIFLVVTINAGDDHRSTVLSLCADLSALLRSVGFRNLDGALSCIMGIGSAAWDRLFGLPPSDILFMTVRGAYAEQQSLGWVGIATLVVAAAGVFSAIQAALEEGEAQQVR